MFYKDTTTTTTTVLRWSLFRVLLFQVAGRYRVMVESSMASADDIIFNSGDVIQLLYEDSSGMWYCGLDESELLIKGRVCRNVLSRVFRKTVPVLEKTWREHVNSIQKHQAIRPLN